MKRLLFVFTLAAVMLLTSCQKLPYFNAKVDGEEFKGLFILGYKGPYTSGQDGFIIIASDGADLKNSAFLAILIKGDQPGDYNLNLDITSDSNIVECAALYFPGGQEDTVKYVAQSGTVKISEVDLDKNKLSGEFNFKMVDLSGNTIDVSNGMFGNLIYVKVNDSLTSYYDFGF